MYDLCSAPRWGILIILKLQRAIVIFQKTDLRTSVALSTKTCCVAESPRDALNEWISILVLPWLRGVCPTHSPGLHGYFNEQTNSTELNVSWAGWNHPEAKVRPTGHFLFPEIFILLFMWQTGTKILSEYSRQQETLADVHLSKGMFVVTSHSWLLLLSELDLIFRINNETNLWTANVKNVSLISSSLRFTLTGTSNHHLKRLKRFRAHRNTLMFTLSLLTDSLLQCSVQLRETHYCVLTGHVY